MSNIISFLKTAHLNGNNWSILKHMMEYAFHINDLHEPIEGDGKKLSNIEDAKWKLDKKTNALILRYLVE